MKYLIYKDTAGEYRWQLQADNRQVIADSGEGYKNKADCRHGIELTKSSRSASVVDVSGT